MIRLPAKGYQVAVPSWNRAELAERTTIELLTSHGVDAERITVFLDAAEPQLTAYADMAERTGVTVVLGPVADRGINAMRHTISRHYRQGTPVVSLDDDVTAVVRAVDPKTLLPIGDLNHFFADSFAQTAAADLAVWGVNAVVNPFFMQAKPSTSLKFLIGTLWGYYSRPGHPVHDTRCEVKEDYESSLRAWFYDGGVFRHNDVAVKADHYKAAGGCQDYRDVAASRDAADILIADWPGLVRLNDKRKSGHAEVLLARKQRHGGHAVDTPVPGMQVI